ncbi:MAG: hypothetical protein IKD29_08235 [Lentisphaeria bacterium]|nr:hypothetical protein [Lentisphaeria bacterium]
MKKVSILLSLCTLLSISAAEAPVISAQDASSVNADMSVDLPKTAGDLLRDDFEAFRKERNIAAYGTPNAKGTTYFTGEAVVAKNVNDAEFITSRSMAYQKAYQDAVAALIMDRVGREITKTIREESSDNSTNAEEAPASLQEANSGLLKKIEVWGEAVIDKKLMEQGIDPKEYADKGIAAKKELYRNSILKSSLKKAFGSAAGCLVVATFEAKTEDGNYAIGVVLRSDEICNDVARCTSKKQRPTLTGKSGLTLQQALPTNEEMLHSFGVRLFFDENGEPALLSFAQWGVNIKKGMNTRMIDRTKRNALTQAENLANQQLTEFINSTIKIDETSLMGEEEISQMVFMKDGSAKKEDFVNIVDKFSKKSTTVGFDSMIGRSTVYKNVLTHKTNHFVAVVVRCWSFGKLDAEQNILDSANKNKSSYKMPAIKREKSGVSRSRVYDF